MLVSFARRTPRLQDGSGEIDLDELRTVMTSLGYSPTDKQLEDMMAKVCFHLQWVTAYVAVVKATAAEGSPGFVQ